MKKNIRDYKRNGKQFSYILDSIENVETCNSKDFKSDKERIEMFIKYFNAEFNIPNNKKRFPNLRERIADYLKGLPSCISLVYTDYDISNLLQGWNIKPTAKNVENYWLIIAARLIQIAEYYNLTF